MRRGEKEEDSWWRHFRTGGSTAPCLGVAALGATTIHKNDNGCRPRPPKSSFYYFFSPSSYRDHRALTSATIGGKRRSTYISARCSSLLPLRRVVITLASSGLSLSPAAVRRAHGRPSLPRPVSCLLVTGDLISFFFFRLSCVESVDKKERCRPPFFYPSPPTSLPALRNPHSFLRPSS